MGHANDQLLDLCYHPWASERLALWYAAGRLDNKTAIPSLERVRGGNGRDCFEVLPLDRMCQHGQTSTLRICKRNPFPLELRLQDAIFLAEIMNDVSLVSIDPTSQPSDQKWQDHGLTSRLKSRRCDAIQYTLNIMNFK
jgi:hypothetical protein